LVLQVSLAFLKVLLEDLDVSSQGEDSSRISRKIENIIYKLAMKEKVLHTHLRTRILREGPI
jgi:hypothetical protein